MYLMTCAPSEDLDQPAHPRRLIGVRRPWSQGVFKRTVKTVIDCADAHVLRYIF